MVSETDTDARKCATKKYGMTEMGGASNALVPAEQALIKHLIANHDKAELKATRNVLESVTALLEENDFWKRQMGNNR